LKFSYLLGEYTLQISFTYRKFNPKKMLEEESENPLKE